MRRAFERLRAGWQRRLADDQEPFQASLVLLIAVLTVLTTVLAGLQVDAGARAAVAERRAEAISAAGAGDRAEGLIQTNSDLGVYRRWIELYFDMNNNGGTSDPMGWTIWGAYWPTTLRSEYDVYRKAAARRIA